MNFLKEKIRARLFGGDVRRMIAKNKIPDQAVSLRRLQQLGFSPASIFDVGAYHGDFSELCFQVWPETRIYAFEALSGKIEGLRNRFNPARFEVVEGIIGQENRDEVAFYADETASSVLSSEEVVSRKNIVTQKMRTLGSFIPAAGIPAPSLLKIDTQGYEYQVLKGCGEHLDAIEVLLLELNFIEVYENVHLAHEVIQFLASRNFVIYDICEIHRRPLDYALFQIDFLFVKQDSFLRADKRWAPPQDL